MRKEFKDEVHKLCNSCLHKKNSTLGKPMSKIKMLIEIPSQKHAQIEEFCLSHGKSLSEYFIDLHDLNISEGWTDKQIKESNQANKIEENEKNIVNETPSKKKSGKK